MDVTPAPVPPSPGSPTALFVKDIVIDCTDVDRQARFWSALLDCPVLGRTGPYVWLERREGVGLALQQVSERPTGTNRLHLDLGAADPASEQRRVEELGGQRATEYEGGGFLVMRDPEGNEFCIIPDGPFDVDDQGRADYLGRT